MLRSRTWQGIYSRPALIGDALFLATAHRLYLIAVKP